MSHTASPGSAGTRTIPTRAILNLLRETGQFYPTLNDPAYGNAYGHDFFSARIGCQTYGVYGIDLAALCLRSRQRQAHAS